MTLPYKTTVAHTLSRIKDIPTTKPLLCSGLLKASIDTISADSEKNVHQLFSLRGERRVHPHHMLWVCAPLELKNSLVWDRHRNQKVLSRIGLP